MRVLRKEPMSGLRVMGSAWLPATAGSGVGFAGATMPLNALPRSIAPATTLLAWASGEGVGGEVAEGLGVSAPGMEISASALEGMALVGTL